jgi:hypothetical protein
MVGFNGIVDFTKEEDHPMMNVKFLEDYNVWVQQEDGEYNYTINV